MAWSPIPHPYSKYLYPSEAKDYIEVGPVGDVAADPRRYVDMSGWRSYLAGSGPHPTSSGPAPTPAQINYRDLIANDPIYKQTSADLSAEGISDAASRAAALRRTLAEWGIIPDFAAAGDKLSAATRGFLSSDIDARTRELAALNEQQGLSQHSRLSRANEDNIRAIRNALASRGMYQSGELGYGLEENARQYTQASTDAEKQVLGQLEEVSGRYTQGERERARRLASEMGSAAQRALAQLGSTGGINTGGTTTSGGTVTGGRANFALPARTATVWDVNTASTYDAINAAKQSGGGVVIRPDDPDAITKANAAAEAGVPVSIQVNGVGDDTPETLAARVAQMQQQFPGASFTLDLESPNFRGGPGTPGWNAMEQYAQQVMAVAGNVPLVITTEGVSDFNYGAWANNPNVIFAPQAYWGDMSPRDVTEIANLLISQGIDPSRIIPVIAPGQDVGGWTGQVSVYGAPSGTSSSPTAPAPVYQAPLHPEAQRTGSRTPGYIMPKPVGATATPTPEDNTVYYISKLLGMV